VEILNNLGLLLGGSWASGVNLYLTIAGLGIADKLGWVSLPGDMDAISNPIVILTALLLYGIEFFADKIPYVDSAWDSIHTLIRPLGSGMLAYMATANIGPVAQIPAALLGGGVAMDSHLTKASSRVAINASPEPITNSVASVTEDSLVIGMLWLIIKHPIISAVATILFILFSIWFLKMMYRFVKKVFSLKKDKKQDLLSGSE